VEHLVELPHPSKEIIGEESDVLLGKRIVLGVTSSVSLYKSIDLARTLMKRGAEVTVVMSEEATRLVSPELFEWATGNKVFHTRFGGEVGHIALSEHNDAMVIAPATANTIAKLAHGIADSPVTLTALSFMGAGKPLILLPTMHKQLYTNPPIQEALRKLIDSKIIIHTPRFEGNRLKYPEVWEIAWHIETAVLRGEDLKTLRVLVTAGPTREYIDKVRFISNASTGKMGVSIAMEALFRGAYVSLIHGPLTGVEHTLSRTNKIVTTEEMYNAVVEEIKNFNPDLVFLAAAPTDFTPLQKVPEKLPSDREYEIKLKPTPKIAEAVSKLITERSVLTIFTAEVAEDDQQLLEKAIAKMQKYQAHVVVANNVGREDIGFASPFNEVIIFDGEKTIKTGKRRKEEIARTIIDVAVKKLREMR
jgi:phosphopantothenoylcysteine decarboxylase/phosphopantothenate--cysteine ligase